jgi:hypothetical protein
MKREDIHVGDVLFYTPPQYVRKGRSRVTYEVTVIAIRSKQIVVESPHGILRPSPKHLTTGPFPSEDR